MVEGLGWRPPPSPWSDYYDTCSYSSVEREQKATFALAAARSVGRGVVRDLGCNEGTYARLAAGYADYVVAVDADHSTADRFYRSLRREGNERILPLVMNLADPTPGLGWRGSERHPLENRGRPDLVLCLALVHHLRWEQTYPSKRSSPGWGRSALP
ncbi:MAG: class I SAM-dependent methyltransferase [Actinomycetota bacterium]|nr:class I SAM-dependent methyltransferase [Actinomycetota bacterium]